MTPESFVTVFYSNYAEDVTKNFKSFLDHNLYIDLVFVCRNNKKVGAHQVVLGCLSKFFYSIFVENLNTMKEKIIYIYVPDIRAKIMKYILQFIYSGKAILNEGELNEFNEDIKLLGMPLDLFQPLDDTTENSSKSKTKNLRSNQTNTCLDIVDLTAPAKNEKKLPSLDLTSTTLNECAVSDSSTSLTVAPAIASSSDVPVISETVVSIIKKNSNSNLPIITNVRALDSKNVFESTSNSARNNNEIQTDSFSQNLNCSNEILKKEKIVQKKCGTNSYYATNKIHNTVQSSEDFPPGRKRKKSNTFDEINKNIEACINLDNSDDESDVITLT